MEVKRFTGLFLMLLIVLASHEALMPTEGRTCESRSKKFRGICFIKSNCENVCITEGFTSGYCRGMRRRCFCTKDCGTGGGSPPPPPPPEGGEGPSQPPVAI